MAISAVSNDAKPILAALKNKQPIKVETADDAAIFLRAVTNLGIADVDLSYLMPLMKMVFARHYDSSLQGEIRRAACYLDAAKFRVP